MRPTNPVPTAAHPTNPALRALLLTVLAVLLAAMVGARASAGEPGADATGHLEGSALRVVDSAVARDIDEREPVDRGARLQVGERAWLWLAVANAGPESQVELVWKHDGQTRWRIGLTVGHSRRGWRTWAYKTLRDGDQGQWSVDVVDPTSGTVLHTLGFDVGSTPQPLPDSAQ